MEYPEKQKHRFKVLEKMTIKLSRIACCLGFQKRVTQNWGMRRAGNQNNYAYTCRYFVIRLKQKRIFVISSRLSSQPVLKSLY